MFEMARAYHELGIDDRARRLALASLALRRRLAPADKHELAPTLDLLGAVLLALGQFDSADLAYSEALALRHDVPTLTGLAGVRRLQGRPRDAEALAREALTIDPGQAQSLRSLGQALADQGQYAQAETLYRRALSL